MIQRGLPVPQTCKSQILSPKQYSKPNALITKTTDALRKTVIHVGVSETETLEFSICLGFRA